MVPLQSLHEEGRRRGRKRGRRADGGARRGADAADRSRPAGVAASNSRSGGRLRRGAARRRSLVARRRGSRSPRRNPGTRTDAREAGFGQGFRVPSRADWPSRRGTLSWRHTRCASPPRSELRTCPSATLDRCREFLKDTIRQQIDFSQTDQQHGRGAPAPGKAIPGRRHAVRSAAGRTVAWH